jgi:hypothetical protein
MHGTTVQWTPDGPNLLRDENLDRVRRSLEEGWVCGMHLLFCAGASGYPVAFSTYETYLEHVRQARPGDLFYLWSVGELRKRKLLLVDARYETADHGASSLLSADGLRRIQEYLSIEAKIPYEVLAAASWGSLSLEAEWTDLDPDGPQWERMIEMARLAYVPGGALCILPLTTIDYPEYYLLRGKRPNERGEVPLGGAY